MAFSGSWETLNERSRAPAGIRWFVPRPVSLFVALMLICTDQLSSWNVLRGILMGGRSSTIPDVSSHLSVVTSIHGHPQIDFWITLKRLLCPKVPVCRQIRHLGGVMPRDILPILFSSGAPLVVPDPA